MKLYIMKKDALETLKSNLPEVFSCYYTDSDNKWIWNVYNDNPFIEFKEIQDFKLAPLDSDLSKGEIDMENCKAVYKNLMFLSESQASDERLWAGLTNGVFYDYMRKRWGYDKNPPVSPKKSIGEIKTRYFFEGGTRAGFYRNTLAKCWWVGRMLYDKENSNPFEKLDILGSNNLSTKITDIFHNNTYSSNPEVINGIILAIKHFVKEGKKISATEHIRPTLQLLNAIGGGIILDCLSSDEISEIFIDNIERIMQGDDSDVETNTDDYLDEDDENSEVNEDLKSKEIEDEMYVVIGCKITAVQIKTGTKKSFLAKTINGKLPPLIEKLMGKKVGDTFEVDNKVMRIEQISFR